LNNGFTYDEYVLVETLVPEFSVGFGDGRPKYASDSDGDDGTGFGDGRPKYASDGDYDYDGADEKHYGSYAHVGGGETNAALLYSATSRLLVLSFRSGKIRARPDILEAAGGYVTALHDFLYGSDLDFDGIVVAGHSEGGVMAEAVILKCIETSSRYLERMFLVATGAHLWMLGEERESIVSNLKNRFHSCINTAEPYFDSFATETETDPETQDYDSFDVSLFVSLPKTYLLSDGSVTTIDGALRADTTEVALGGITLVKAPAAHMDGVHSWSAYEKKIGRSFMAAMSGGARKQSWVASWVCLTALTVATSVAHAWFSVA
jgi:hypothetical protein